MKNIVVTLVLMMSVIPLFSQSEDFITLQDIKQENGYDYFDSGYTEDDLYYLSYEEVITMDGNTIPKMLVFYFEDNSSSSKLLSVANVTALKYINNIIKAFNANYVKREGQMIWDDYTDGSWVELSILQENEIISWIWH